MRARTTTFIIAMAVTAGIATSATPAVAASSCANADADPASLSAAQVQGATLCLLNEQRAANGLSPLKAQRKLAKAATQFSQAMVQQQFFDHVSPNGSTLSSRIAKTKYTKGARRYSLGENIAWGTGTRATPAAIVDAWMHSEGHRANILNKGFKEIGIGVAAGAPVATASSASAGATYTTDFGARS